jgi:hypothetical protein
MTGAGTYSNAYLLEALPLAAVPKRSSCRADVSFFWDQTDVPFVPRDVRSLGGKTDVWADTESRPSLTDAVEKVFSGWRRTTPSSLTPLQARKPTLSSMCHRLNALPR